jgi:hypothetical protein
MPKKLPVVANTSPLIALSAVLADFNELAKVKNTKAEIAPQVSQR